jgi:hypothetical protein
VSRRGDAGRCRRRDQGSRRRCPRWPGPRDWPRRRGGRTTRAPPRPGGRPGRSAVGQRPQRRWSQPAPSEPGPGQRRVGGGHGQSVPSVAASVRSRPRGDGRLDEVEMGRQPGIAISPGSSSIRRCAGRPASRARRHCRRRRRPPRIPTASTQPKPGRRRTSRPGPGDERRGGIRRALPAPGAASPVPARSLPAPASPEAGPSRGPARSGPWGPSGSRQHRARPGPRVAPPPRKA